MSFTNQTLNLITPKPMYISINPINLISLYIIPCGLFSPADARGALCTRLKDLGTSEYPSCPGLPNQLQCYGILLGDLGGKCRVARLEPIRPKLHVRRQPGLVGKKKLRAGHQGPGSISYSQRKHFQHWSWRFQACRAQVQAIV